VIRLRGVSKAYLEGGRPRQVLAGVDLDIANGEFVCVMGRSGSGKSTLLNVLAGIDTPDAGQVLFEGCDLARLDDRARTLHRRRHLGFVFQFFNLVPTLTVAENLAMPLELNARADDGAVAAWLARVGLQTRAASYPDMLSGGEQQRIAIARALVHAPALVLADEPTGNLDADTAGQVLGLLGALCRDAGTTLLVASHSAEMARAADRVLLLDHGRLRPGAVP
jgi:putative ABC transport system ATP-binding protein